MCGVQVDRLVMCHREVHQLPSHSEVHGTGTGGEVLMSAAHMLSLVNTKPAKSKNASFPLCFSSLSKT